MCAGPVVSRCARARRRVADERSPRLPLLVAVLLIALNLRPTITGVGPFLKQIAEDLGTSEAALGALAAVPLIAFAVVSPFAHGISARFGMPRAVQWSLVLMGAGTVWRSLPGPAANLWSAPRSSARRSRS